MEKNNASENAKKTCLQCDHRIIGRIDKKFCTDDCRVRYHNKLNREIKNTTGTINRILSRNRKILAHFCAEGKTSLPLLSVIAKGFNLNYFTHAYKTDKDINYRFVYEQGYRIQEGTITIMGKIPNDDINLSDSESLLHIFDFNVA